MIKAGFCRPRNKRQAVWDILYRGGYHTPDGVAETAGIPLVWVRTYMSKLCNGGYITPDKGTRFSRRAAYMLQRQDLKDAPCLNANGSPSRGGRTEAMWRSIRILRRFTEDELYGTVNITHRVGRYRVAQYLAALARAGYLRETQAENGRHYLLRENTGPEAPRLINTVEIYDPNLNEITLREVPDYE